MSASKNAERELAALEILSGERKGIGYDALRGILGGLARVYSIGLDAYLGLEIIGIRRRTILPSPTISIGNLSSGGTGKTPMTQYVCSLLEGEGFRPAILSRGHGGSASRAGAQVSTSGGDILLDASESGDESAALAKFLPGVPVYVGKDRRVSGKAAYSTDHPDLFVLDDGLQYWQLARDLDIVLLDARKPFDNGYCLPRGLLREPKEHVRRAGIVVLTRADLAGQAKLDQSRAAASKLAPSATLFEASHRFAGFRPLNEAARNGATQRPLAVCGIAQPESFQAMLMGEGIEIVGLTALSDHAVYDDVELGEIEGTLKACRAGSIITTDKDAVKLPAERFDVPVFSASLKIEIGESKSFRRELLTRSGLVRGGEPVSF